jgi:hypothetical protein
MPTYVEAGGYANGFPAGTEVSSTYEGRHIEILESDLTHPSHTDGFVDRGDPIIFNDLAQSNYTAVGVALTSAAAATDFIAVDTEGVWNLAVVSSDDDGNSAIVYGDQIFIHVTTGVLSKIRNANTHRPFGYSLNTVTVTGAGTATVIAVKVHWDPYWSVVIRPKVGASGAPFVNDTANTSFREFRYDSGATSGDNRGTYLRVQYTGAGGGGDCMRIYADVSVAASNVFGLHVSAGFGESTTGGSVTGSGIALRAQIGLPNVAMAANGTYAAVMPEIFSFGAAADPSAVTELSFIRCTNAGNGTGVGLVDHKAYLLSLVGGSIDTNHIVEVAEDETEYAWNARCLLPGGQVAYMMFASART